MKISVVRIIFGLALLSSLSFVSKAQSVMPEVLDTGTVNQQLEYLQSKTNVYNNYRAVRDDMFLKLKSNVLKSEQKLKNEIQQLNADISNNNEKISALESELAVTKTNLEEAVETKNSFKLLGINIDKVLYNTVLWVIILALGALAVISFLLYKRSMVTTNQLKRELEELKNQFDEYKRQAREKQEKLVVTHHKEMMKLKKEMGV